MSDRRATPPFQMIDPTADDGTAMVCEDGVCAVPEPVSAADQRSDD